MKLVKRDPVTIEFNEIDVEWIRDIYRIATGEHAVEHSDFEKILERII